MHREVEKRMSPAISGLTGVWVNVALWQLAVVYAGLYSTKFRRGLLLSSGIFYAGVVLVLAPQLYLQLRHSSTFHCAFRTNCDNV